MVINAIYGARSVDPRLLETARSYGYSGFRLIWRIVVPSASPHIMTGLRFALAIAIIIVIGTEILGSDVGIGYLTLLMQRTYSTPEMYACVFSLCILGYVLNRLFRLVEGKVMAWYFGFTSTIR
jgi:ABC-type nitrate/sulfonate/bicarbonate transport system permease component